MQIQRGDEMGKLDEVSSAIGELKGIVQSQGKDTSRRLGNIESHLDKLNNRVGAIERWKSTLSGGMKTMSAMVSAFVALIIIILNKFLGS